MRRRLHQAQDLAQAVRLEELDEHAGPLVLEPGQGRDLDVEVRLQLLVLQKLVVGEVDLAAGLLDPVVQVIEAGLGRGDAVGGGCGGAGDGRGEESGGCHSHHHQQRDSLDQVLLRPRSCGGFRTPRKQPR